MTKVVICGGHLTPALALIESLEKKNSEVIFFGRKYSTEGSKVESSEFKIITSKKIKFCAVTAGRLQRKFTRHTVPSLLKIPIGLTQSLFFLIAVRPNIVVSFGGYLSLPVIFSSWLLGIRSITHEQSASAGLANQINSLFCEKVFISWPSSQKYFPKDKTELIGNMIRKSIFNTTTNNRKITSLYKDSKKNLYITGGNLGSHFLNNLVFENQELFKNYNVIHQVGIANYKEDHQKAKQVKLNNYFFESYIGDDDIGFILKNAHVVISRSGANTVYELASLAKTAILIPLPISAGDEQQLNAQILQSAGSAVVINQKEATRKTLEETLKSIEKNYEKFKKNAESLKKTISTSASDHVAHYLLK